MNPTQRIIEARAEVVMGRKLLSVRNPDPTLPDFHLERAVYALAESVIASATLMSEAIRGDDRS